MELGVIFFQVLHLYICFFRPEWKIGAVFFGPTGKILPPKATVLMVNNLLS
jgi:hypothetical protein